MSMLKWQVRKLLKTKSIFFFFIVASPTFISHSSQFVVILVSILEHLLCFITIAKSHR